MTKTTRNYSVLFTLLSHEKPTKTSNRLSKIGRFCFSVSFLSSIVLILMGSKRQGTLLFNIFGALFGGGFLIGLIIFLIFGTYFIGRDNGKTNIFSSSLFVLKKVCLYMFLPAAVIVSVIILYAYLTHQPAVR